MGFYIPWCRIHILCYHRTRYIWVHPAIYLKFWTIRFCFSAVNRWLSATTFLDIVTISVDSLDINMCTSKLIFQIIFVIFVHIVYFNIFSKDGPEAASIRRIYKLRMLKNFTWRIIKSKKLSYNWPQFWFIYSFYQMSISYHVLWQTPKAVYIKYTSKNWQCRN